MHTFSRRRLSAVVGAAAGAAAVGASAAPAAADPGREGGPAADGHRPDTEGRPLSVRDELLRRMKVPSTLTTADGPVWSPVATGFASVASEALPQGAVGGLGGRRSEERRVGKEGRGRGGGGHWRENESRD